MGEVYIDRLGRTQWRDSIPDNEESHRAKQVAAVPSIHDFCMSECGNDDFDPHPDSHIDRPKPSEGKISLQDAIIKLNAYMSIVRRLAGEFQAIDNYWFMKPAEESAYVRDYEKLHSQIVRAAQAIRECQLRGETEVDPALCRIEV